MKLYHKTTTKRRIITIDEWAYYLKLNRHTVRKNIKKYEEEGRVYNSRDILSILDFFKYIYTKYYES